MSVIVDVVRGLGVTRWRVRPVRDVLRERAWSVGRIEDALARRLWT
jgi:hypothetical protein